MTARLPSSAADRAGAVLTVDLAAITENWRLLARKTGPQCDCGAVVKADAYGLGAEQIAPALAAAGCTTFYVAHLDEGIELRAALGQTSRIIVMHGPNPGTEGEFFRYGLIPVLNTPEQILGWRRFAADADVLQETVIQVDTGMNRLGLTEKEFLTHMDDPDGFQGLTPLAVMSHPACAGTPDHELNTRQHDRFASAVTAFRTKFPSAKATLANSAGIFLGVPWHYEMVRPGAALYGLAPQSGQPNPMISAVRLQAKILQVRRVDTSETVGYGATYRAPDGAKLATVSIGYADGIIRSLSNSGTALLDDIAVPVAGLVSMDLLTFDVSNVPDSAARPGALIDILSTKHTVDDLALEAGTIGYEILTSLGHRYARRYLPASSGPAT